MNDNIALLTGAAGGIGTAIAEELAESGWLLVLNGLHHPERTEALAHRLGEERCLAVCADVSDSEAVADMFRQAGARFGPVNLLINNAGIARTKLLQDVTDADWRAMIGTHLDGTFYCCRAALPDMIARKSGNIINVSSIWGLSGGACEVPYSAAKAGIIGLTKALAKEVGPSGIRVNCIAPGIIDTPMNDQFSADEKRALCEETPLERFGRPQEIARTVRYLLDCAFVTGQVISPNGGFVI